MEELQRTEKLVPLRNKEKIQAGIILTGTEVKSLRLGKVALMHLMLLILMEIIFNKSNIPIYEAANN